MTINMRDLINIIIEQRALFEETGEWRAWIETDGQVHEIPDDETHAEFAYYRPEYSHIDNSGDVEGPDFAFDDVLNRGWIRVAVTADASAFIINFDLVKTTVQSLKALLKVLNVRHADSYAIEVGNGFQEVQTHKEIAAIINRMVVQKSRHDAG